MEWTPAFENVFRVLARASFLQNLRICVNPCLLDRNPSDSIVHIFMLTERILQGTGAQEHSKAMHIIKLIQCVKDGKLGKLLGVIPKSEAIRFKEALEHDLELRREWKEVMRNFRVSVESLATGISSTVDETEKWFDSLGRYSVKRTLGFSTSTLSLRS